VSTNDTESVLSLLADVRRTQRTVLETMQQDTDWVGRLRIGHLIQAVDKLAAAVPSKLTGQQITTLRRDISELRADVASCKVGLADVAAKANGVKTYMVGIKAKLDVFQTRIEESDV
jgi:hypothetical protein